MSQAAKNAAAQIPPPAARIIGALDGLNTHVGKAVSWLVIPMMLSLICEVVMRYFFQKPTIWAMDVAILLYSVYFMLGSPYCLLTGNHIRTDFFYHNWSVRTKAAVDIFNYVVFFFPAHLVFFNIACQYFYKSWLQNEVAVTSPWMPVIWPVKLAIPICVGLTLAQGVSEVLKCWYRWKTGADLWPVSETGEAEN